MTDPIVPPAKLPPAWFMHAFWRVHRVLNRLSGGRLLWKDGGKRGWGAMRLTTVGRKSGRARPVIIGYLQNGPDVIAMAMNGWDEGDPAWWLNLEAHPDAVVQLPHQPPRPVHAHRAEGAEHDRLWKRWAEVDVGLDSYAALRTNDTPIVVFEPRDVA